MYLADVRTGGGSWSRQRYGEAIKKSKWFTRGWILQELLAPESIEFFDARWRFIGTRSDLQSTIQTTTGIDASFLGGRPIEEASVAQRMSWAVGRTTLKKGDKTYCLLGIFGVNLPLIYGEGDRAFIRLQEGIMKTCNDQTLFAWGIYTNHSNAKGTDGSILARSPADFLGSAQVVRANTGRTHTWLHPTLHGGFTFEVPTLVDEDYDTIWMVLDVRAGDNFIAVPLCCQVGGTSWMRAPFASPASLPITSLNGLETRNVHVLRKYDSVLVYSPSHIRVQLNFASLLRLGQDLWEVYPYHAGQRRSQEGSILLLLEPRPEFPTYVWLGCMLYPPDNIAFSGLVLRLSISSLEDLKCEVVPMWWTKVEGDYPVLCRGLGGNSLKLDNITTHYEWATTASTLHHDIGVQRYRGLGQNWDVNLVAKKRIFEDNSGSGFDAEWKKHESIQNARFGYLTSGQHHIRCGHHRNMLATMA